MSAERFAVTTFCDDIRQEVGNKLSLIGVYSGDLLVDRLPTVLPKLCAQVRIAGARGTSFGRLFVRAFLNGDVLGELELPVDDANKALRSMEPESVRIQLLAVLTFSPFVIDKEGDLRIEVETESEALKGGRLRLMLKETHRRRLEERAMAEVTQEQEANMATKKGNGETTSAKVATAASKVLSNPKSSKAMKSIAASALTQKVKKK